MPNLDPAYVAAIVTQVLASMDEDGQDDSTPATAGGKRSSGTVGETPEQRAARIARPKETRRKRTTRAKSGAQASSARKPRKDAPEVWTVKESWKGVEPTSGILWAARKYGVAPKLIATGDKYMVSCAIATKRGIPVEVIA